MSVIGNEQVKLSATITNNVAAALIIAGFFTPLIGFSYGLPSQIANMAALPIGLGWFFCGVGLHFYARMLLKRLKP